MNWINKLERKFGRYAIHNLMHYIIILYAVGFALNLIAPGFYMEYLSLDASAILHGQIWRIVTFLIQPPDGSPIFIIFALYLYYMIGQNLEAAWGAFRFNLYFLYRSTVSSDCGADCILPDRNFIPNRDFVLESVTVFCLCGTVSECGIFAVLCHSD